MDFYVIPPVAHLELMDLGNRYFCLAQIYRKNENYRNFFKQKVAEGKWVTLDNGVGDHDFISQDELFNIMKDLQPSEVIPLDVLYDGGKTVKNALEFITRMKSEGLGHIEVLAVPQGFDLDDWIYSYKRLSKIPEVKTIGMSKIGIPWVMSHSFNDENIGRDRNKLVDMLEWMNLLEKPLHFLGSGEPSEYAHYKGSPYVRSTDSCFTVFSGMNMVKFDESFKRIPTPKDYFHRQISEEQMVVVKENIRIFRQLLS